MKHKYFITLLLACTLHATTNAQVTIVNQKTIGGSNDDNLGAVYSTKDGGLLVGGSSYSSKSGDKIQHKKGQSDYWIIKFDSLRNVQWSKDIGGGVRDNLTCIQPTKDGGYILGGSSDSYIYGDKTEDCRNMLDYWVVKVDSRGRIQWNKTVGGSDLDNLSCVLQTNDGGYILGGYSSSNISWEKSEHSRGGYDYWIVKLDSAGKFQWDKTMGGNKNDQLSSLLQTSDGNYILGGSSASNRSGEKSENNKGKRGIDDYWIVKIDGNGKKLWDKTIGGDQSDGLKAMQLTSDGGYILGGWSNSNTSFDKSENSKGSTDYWIVKTDSLGNVQWDKTIGGSDGDNLESLQQTSDGGFVLSGESYSNISGDKTENNRRTGQFVSTDYWVVKLDEAHQIEWDKTIGGGERELGGYVKEISASNYAIGGSSNSGISGDKTEASRGGYDYWIVYLKDNNSPAPVTITNLKAYEQNNIIKVDWTTIRENNIAKYEIQRSYDTLSFATIGNVTATGNSTQTKDYTFNDMQPSQGNNYYRIKMINKDGKIIYSNSVFVNIIHKTSITTYPNPVYGILHVQINGEAVVSLADQSGKILLIKTIDGAGVINVASLQPGLYYLKNTATDEVQKVIITK